VYTPAPFHVYVSMNHLAAGDAKDAEGKYSGNNRMSLVFPLCPPRPCDAKILNQFE